MTNQESEIPPIDWGRTDLLIELALSEDLDTTGDVTTNSVVPENASAEAVLLCKEPGMVLAGLPVAERVFKLVEPRLEFKAIREDGDRCEYGEVLAEIHGPARGLLIAERTALNFLQRLSGVATTSAKYAAALEGTKTLVLDTRKTTPGYRNLEKYAVAVGGATNHRIGLYDRVMIKDNHREMAAMEGPGGIARSVERARQAHPELEIEVEADTLDEVREAVEAGADHIMLDNMSDEMMAEAVKLVREALAPLGGEYAEKLSLAFSQRWIDVPERRGKRSGAYSGGCYDSYPYLLLNYNRTLNDVFTLAHELGHSMHSFYSNATQPYHYAGYSIFVAEVASTTNEMLLFRHLLDRSTDREFRAFLLGHLADEIRGTIFRQTMFAEFELLAHELVEQGVPLSADLLNEKYAELNTLYYGPEVEADPLIAVEWARIPHFYYNFYVYKYATGMSAAIQLAERLASGDPAGREAYFGFLKAGDSKDVLDIMKDAGVDLSTPAPVEAALGYFRSTVRQLRRELGR